MSYKGKFHPTNRKKYKGDINNIVYRSLWERKFMVYCDENNDIVEWGSEELVVPYISPLDRKLNQKNIPNHQDRLKEFPKHSCMR